MATLIVRNTAPDVSNPCYRSVQFGGYNRCIIRDYNTGFVLPNCVGYAWGRFLEANGLTDCSLSTGNASQWWYNTADGYQRGSVPKIGAVGCYGGGSYGGAGHVLFVESINGDGSIVCSESNYGGEIFQMRTLQPDLQIGWSLYFQGFIYSPTDFDGSDINPDPVPPDPPVENQAIFKWYFQVKNIQKRMTNRKKIKKKGD